MHTCEPEAKTTNQGMNMSTETELDALVPTYVDMTIGGKAVKVGPLTLGQLLQVRKAFDAGQLTKLPADADFGQLFDAFPDEMIEVCMIATGLTREEMEAGTAEEAIDLCATLIERNRDFFARRLGPSLKKLMGELIRAAAMVGDGSTPLKS